MPGCNELGPTGEELQRPARRLQQEKASPAMLKEDDLAAPSSPAPEAVISIFITTTCGHDGAFDVHLDTISSGGLAAEWPSRRRWACWLKIKPMAATPVSAKSASIIPRLPTLAARLVEVCLLRALVSLSLCALH